MTRYLVNAGDGMAVELVDMDITDYGWLTGVTQSGQRRLWSPGSDVYVREIGEVSEDE